MQPQAGPRLVLEGYRSADAVGGEWKELLRKEQISQVCEPGEESGFG